MKSHIGYMPVSEALIYLEMNKSYVTEKFEMAFGLGKFKKQLMINENDNFVNEDIKMSYYILIYNKQQHSLFYYERPIFTAVDKFGNNLYVKVTGYSEISFPDRADYLMFSEKEIKNQYCQLNRIKGRAVSEFLANQEYSDNEVTDLCNMGLLEYCNWFTYEIKDKEGLLKSEENPVISTMEECFNILENFKKGKF